MLSSISVLVRPAWFQDLPRTEHNLRVHSAREGNVTKHEHNWLCLSCIYANKISNWEVSEGTAYLAMTVWKQKIISSVITGIETLPGFQKGVKRLEKRKRMKEKNESCASKSWFVIFYSFSSRFPCFSVVEASLQLNNESVDAALSCTMILTLWR